MVVGVNQQEEAETAREFAEAFAVTYPIALDADGQVSSAYRVSTGLPVSFLIDPEGRDPGSAPGRADARGPGRAGGGTSLMASGAPATSASAAGGDPLRAVWRLLTNVKFAVALVSAAVLASLLGVVLPQLPAEMRGNPGARSAWLELQRQDFGWLTGILDGLDLFEVFHSPWFTALWFVIVAAVTVCTISRFPPTWRSVQRPPVRVGERYFETARHRASFTHAGGAEAVEALLAAPSLPGGAHARGRGRHGAVRGALPLDPVRHLRLAHGAAAVAGGGTADEPGGFPANARPGGGAPGRAALRRARAGGRSSWGWRTPTGGVDTAGNIVDFHSDLLLRRGEEVVRCTATVNGPCSAFGYRFHQAAFFDDLAQVTIWGPDGRVLFDDVLDFENESTATPALTVTDADGVVVFDQALPQMASVPGSTLGYEGDLGLAELVLPGAVYGVSWRAEGETLVAIIDGQGFDQVEVRPGEVVETPAHRIAFRGIASVPATPVLDMPRGETVGVVNVQMPEGADGRPFLFISNIDAGNVVIREGATVETASGYRYRFGGRVDASGIDVRRDPGDTFIWVAVGLAMLGLGITFYVPRRRLWVRVTGQRTQLAGIAARTTRFGRELRHMGAELGARDALLPEDRDEESA